MEQVFERVCGLESTRPRLRQYVQTFGTTTADLLALRDWLEAHGVTMLRWKSTAVYWKLVYYVLEEARDRREILARVARSCHRISNSEH